MVAGGEGPRRPLAMHADVLPHALHRMLLDLGDVVGHVVEQMHVEGLPGAAEDVREDLPHVPHQQLAVAEGVVGGGPHRPQVVPPLGALHRGADELAIGQDEAVFRWRLAEAAEGVVADLVAQAAGARMDEHADLAGLEPEGRGCGGVLDAIDHLHFDEVVAGAHGAALIGSPGQRPIAHEFRRGAGDAALGLGAGDVVGRGQPLPGQEGHAVAHECAELGGRKHERPSLPDAHGDVADHPARAHRPPHRGRLAGHADR